MEQGKYSILLGKFERFSVLPAQPGSGDGSAQISLVDVKVALRSLPPLPLADKCRCFVLRCQRSCARRSASASNPARAGAP